MSQQTLHISTSPHLAKPISTPKIMWHVVLALSPLVFFSGYVFGVGAVLVIFTAVISCVLTEHWLCTLSRKETTIGDGSATITGILLGLILPPIFPLWMTFLGGMIAIGMGKFIFGGLGCNVFNPALVGRAVLQAAFPVAMTTWMAPLGEMRFSLIHSSLFTFPFMKPVIDGMTGATPLSAFKFDGVTADAMDLAVGYVSGSTGETSSILILLGGLYLSIRKFLDWRIPIAILATVFLLSGVFYQIDPEIYPAPTFMLFSGGVMLGAVFMATDMVASPVTSMGTALYGVFIGLLICVIRLWGGLPEGVMYAILIGNAVSPHIDRLITNRVYGTKRKGDG